MASVTRRWAGVIRFSCWQISQADRLRVVLSAAPSVALSSDQLRSSSEDLTSAGSWACSHASSSMPSSFTLTASWAISSLNESTMGHGGGLERVEQRRHVARGRRVVEAGEWHFLVAGVIAADVDRRPGPLGGEHA